MILRTPEQVAEEIVEKREGRVVYPMTQIAKGNILSATLAVRSDRAMIAKELKFLVDKYEFVKSAHVKEWYIQINKIIKELDGVERE